MSKQKSKRSRQETINKDESLMDMKTNLEQQLEEVEEKKVSRIKQIKKNNTFREDQQEELEDVGRVTVNDLKVADQEKLSLLVNHLLAKNKINAKNAFEVPLIHLSETNDFTSMENDNSWKKVSSNLENNNKIYGYRVDAAHNFTYKVLELITRSERKEGTEEEELPSKISSKYNQLSLNTQFFSDCLEDYYIKHLEKNQKNINIPHVQTFFNANPILEKTKRTFDQQGLKALLLNNIGIGEDLALLINLTIEPSIKIQSIDSDSQQQPPEVLIVPFPTNSNNIFTKINGICYLNNLIEDEEVTIKIESEESEFETIWREFEQMAKPNVLTAVQINLQTNQEPVTIQNDPGQECIQVKKEIQQRNEEKDKENQQQQGQKLTENEEINFDQNQQNAQSRKEIPVENNCAVDKPEEKEINPEVQSEKEPSPAELEENSVGTEKESLPEKQQEHHNSELEGGIEGLPLAENAGQEEKNNFDENKGSNPQVVTQHLPVQPKEAPISSVITFRYFKKHHNQQDPILRQLQVGTQGENEKDSALQRWKNIDNKSIKIPRKSRQKKEKDPTLDEVNFKQPLDMRKSENRRSAILRVDKVKKLEIKKFLRNAAEYYNQYTFTCFNQQKWKASFDMVSFLRQSFQDTEEQYPQNQIHNYRQVIDIELLNSTAASAQLRAASIRSAKQKIRVFMLEDHLSSFIKIYNKYASQEGPISPALCFLTVLHLCNEKGLELVQKQDSDFEIVTPQ